MTYNQAEAFESSLIGSWLFTRKVAGDMTNSRGPQAKLITSTFPHSMLITSPKQYGMEGDQEHSLRPKLYSLQMNWDSVNSF